MENDRSYFLRRAAQERSAATCAEGKARAVQLELADRYEQRAATESAMPVPGDHATAA
jgi:hypothetical protein